MLDLVCICDMGVLRYVLLMLGQMLVKDGISRLPDLGENITELIMAKVKGTSRPYPCMRYLEPKVPAYFDYS